MIRIILFIHLCLSPVIFSIYATEPFETIKNWFLYLAALLILSMRVKNRRPQPSDVAIALTVISAALCVFPSVSPRMSIFGNSDGPMGLFTIFSLAIVYWATRSAFTRYTDRRILMLSLVIISLPVNIYAILQVAGYDTIQWNRTLTPFGFLRPFGTLGHPNILGGWLVMVLPFVLLTVFETLWGLIPLTTLAAALFFTQSRGCWVAAMAVIIIMFWGTIGTKNVRILALAVGAWALLLLLGAGLAVTLNGQYGQLILDRFTHIFVLDDSRREYWTTAWRIFKANPFMGCGTDAFKLAFEHARTEHYWLIERAGSPNKAHNDFLNTLATQGILGITAWLSVLGTFLLQARRSLLKANEAERLFTLALIASGVAYYVQNISGFPSIPTSVLFMTVLALLTPKTFDSFKQWGLKAVFLVGVLFLICLGHNFIYLPLTASVCVGQAARIEMIDPTTALAIYDRQAVRHPDAQIYASMGFLAERMNRWDIALGAFVRAHELEKAEAIYALKVGMLANRRDFVQLAHEMEPNNPIFNDVLRQM